MERKCLLEDYCILPYCMVYISEALPADKTNQKYKQKIIFWII